MPPDWPDPPLLEYLLLESPWGPAAVFLAIAGGMFVAGGRRGRPRIQQLALLPLLAAVGLPILAHFVRTDTERIRANTRRLVEAVSDPFDPQTLEKLTAEDAHLLHWNRERLLRAARRASQVATVTQYTITNLMAYHRGEKYGKSYVAVIGRADYRGGFGGGFKTRWLLNWRKSPDGVWRLSGVEKVSVNGRDAEDVLRSMVR